MIHPTTLSTAEMDSYGQRLVRMATGDEPVCRDTLKLCAQIITHTTAKLVLIREAAK